MYIAARVLTIGKKMVPAGEIVQPEAGRNLTPLIGAGHIIDVPDDALKAVVEHALDGDFGRAGGIRDSGIQPRVVDVEGESVKVETLARAAFDRSGLSTLGWNALPDDAREMLLIAEVALWGGPMVLMPAGDGDGEPAPPDEPPEGPHIRFNPAEHGLKFQGKTVGYTVVTRDGGEIVARVTKATYQDLKAATKAGRSVFAPIVEGDEG